MSGEETSFEGLGLAEALRRVSGLLAKNRIGTAATDARILLLAAAEMDHVALIRDPDFALSPNAAKRLEDFVSRRLAGEPPSRILGSRHFWTMNLRVTPDVLDPRPDTETIVEAVLDAIGPRRNDPLRILDLGAGSGALLLALLTEFSNATGIGVDISSEACEVARQNAERNGLASRAEIREGSWTDGLSEAFDVVVSNPPYIESGAIAGLEREVRSHDPMLALDGGPDGLDAYRAITAALPSVLRPDGVAVLELGIGQGPSVAALAGAAGFSVRAIRRDLAGIERALVLEQDR